MRRPPGRSPRPDAARGAGSRAPAGLVPLARALSKQRLASRADARALILAGRVEVNGKVALNPAALVHPERAAIRIDGVAGARAARTLLLFHKPRGVVTTHRDPAHRRTVFDVIGADASGLITVGRLDMASTGLLLLTNDTQLAHRLTDPASRIVRQYVVTVSGHLTDEDAQRLMAGIAAPAPGGTTERLRAVSATIRKASQRETHLIVELNEGRNREIRRMFEFLGREVTRLHRVTFGPFALGDLPAGTWRAATASEEVAAERLQPALRRAPRRAE